ncbi:MAG: L28 family ribosomal protein [Candidatus Uhrbacteria bacterium]
MSKFCDACGRGALSAQNRSKSLVATKRTQKVNLQNKTVDGKKAKVCTKCIRSSSKDGFELKLGAEPRVGLRSKKTKKK